MTSPGPTTIWAEWSLGCIIGFLSPQVLSIFPGFHWLQYSETAGRSVGFHLYLLGFQYLASGTGLSKKADLIKGTAHLQNTPLCPLSPSRAFWKGLSSRTRVRVNKTNEAPCSLEAKADIARKAHPLGPCGWLIKFRC